MKSTIVSFWLLTVAAGNFLVAMITKFGSKAAEGQAGSDSVTAGRFLTYALMTFAVAIVFVFVAMAYRYRDAEAGESKA
jgi:dipeptide/tripeptide permease